MNDCIVITTINPPAGHMLELIETLGTSWRVVIVGDVTTPSEWEDYPVEYLSIERQHEMFGAYAADAPTRHYSRKNFGYLYALRCGATRILETDDDNIPTAKFGRKTGIDVEGRLIGGEDWVNVYRWFTDRLVWPRGLPLDAIHRRGDFVRAAGRNCPIQQFLVDDDPDVDAIYRLVFPQDKLVFDADAEPLLVEPGTWSPFNSQNTLWFEEAFPLLYLPNFCNSRVTDIWRSLVAQRALWLHNRSVAFHTATVRQLRNAHVLSKDFMDELPVYTQAREVAHCLDEIAGQIGETSMAQAGLKLWQGLVAAGFLPASERSMIGNWFDSLPTRPRREAVETA